MWFYANIGDFDFLLLKCLPKNKFASAHMVGLIVLLSYSVIQLFKMLILCFFFAFEH